MSTAPLLIDASSTGVCPSAVLVVTLKPWLVSSSEYIHASSCPSGSFLLPIVRLMPVPGLPFVLPVVPLPPPPHPASVSTVNSSTTPSSFAKRDPRTDGMSCLLYDRVCHDRRCRGARHPTHARWAQRRPPFTDGRR